MQTIKAFVLAFIPAFFCFSLMLMGTLLWVQPYSPGQEAPASANLFLPKEEDRMDLLLIHEGQQIRSYTFLSIDPSIGKVRICTFPPTAVINGEKLGELEPEDIKELFALYFREDIERQILLSNQDLMDLVDDIGSVELLTEGFSYVEKGLPVTVEAGRHRMDGQLLLRYLQNGKTPLEVCQRSEAALQSYLEKLLPRLNQEIFLNLLDHMESDLCLADYDQRKDGISLMCQLTTDTLVVPYSPN